MEWVFIISLITSVATALVTGVALGLLGAGLNPILLVGITVLGGLIGVVVSFGLLLLAGFRGPDSEILVVAEAFVLMIVVPIVTTVLGVLLLARLIATVSEWATIEAGLHPAAVTTGAVIVTMAIITLGIGLLAYLGREPTVESLTVGLRRNPADPYLLSDRARLYAEKGELELAIADYSQAIERAIQLEPIYLAVLLQERARLYAQQGRLDEAIADDTRAIETEPTGNSALRDRARLYAQRGDIDLAIADATAAIEREEAPRHRSTAHVERGRIFAEQGELDLAIADYTRAIEIESPFEASAASYVEDLRVADPDYQGSIGDDYVWPYVWRGEARARSGDPEGARADFDHALRLARLGPEAGTAPGTKTSRQQHDEIEAVMRSVGLNIEPSTGA